MSSYKGELVSVSTASQDCKESKKPSNLDDDKLWQEKGWIVKVDYTDLDQPITFKDYIKQIQEMQADKYAPFNKNGGGNQGYLFEIDSNLASYLIGLAKENQVNRGLKEYLTKLEDKSEEIIVRETEKFFSNKKLEKTEENQVIKARIGQGKFRRKLEKTGCKFKMCGMSNRDLLVASHIKPWRDSNNRERLDFYNGFLLCPGHDALFDKGYISFNDNGKIIISKIISSRNLELLNIKENIKINIKKGHKDYLEWHRKNIFIDSI